LIDHSFIHSFIHSISRFVTGQKILRRVVDMRQRGRRTRMERWQLMDQESSSVIRARFHKLELLQGSDNISSVPVIFSFQI